MHKQQRQGDLDPGFVGWWRLRRHDALGCGTPLDDEAGAGEAIRRGATAVRGEAWLVSLGQSQPRRAGVG